MFDMKYLYFLAYLLINLVNCRFFVTSDYSLQKQVQYTLFLFLCTRFHKAEITSRRILYYVATYLLLRRDVANAASGRNFHFLSWLWFLLFPAILQRSGRRNTLRPYSHIPQKDCSILPYLVIIHYTNVLCAFYATQITQ